MAVMVRRLFTPASAISLLLCLSTGLLWARSYNHLDEINDSRLFVVDRNSADDVKTQLYERATNIMSQRGRVQFWQIRTVPATWHREESFWAYRSFDLQPTGSPGVPEAGRLGFSLQRETIANRASFDLVFPLWAFCGTTSILPGLWVLTWWKGRTRRLTGHCRRCGYDLTANVSGVCPECGGFVPESIGANP